MTSKRSTFSAPRKDWKPLAPAVSNEIHAAFRSGTDSVEHHREVLKLAPDFHDAELTIGLMNYIIGSLPLPAKMLAATMGVRGSKKRGLEALERVAKEGKWARDIARMLLIDLYKREKRCDDAAEDGTRVSGEVSAQQSVQAPGGRCSGPQIVTKSKKPPAEKKSYRTLCCAKIRRQHRELVNVR